MRALIEEITYKNFQRVSDSNEIKALRNETEQNRKKLSKQLSRTKRKLVMRIIDEKDLVTELTNTQSFVVGLKLGLKIGYEVNRD